MSPLAWPPEAATYPNDDVHTFLAPGSNVLLDFHGDPVTAGLVLFSDGNHHMALEAAVRAFVGEYPRVRDVFYTTAPPAPLIDALKGNGLALGNMRISRKPDVFISPDNIVKGLAVDGFVTSHVPFAESRGSVLLVRKGNPKSITSIADLLSDEVTLTCSNPISEKASFAVYKEAISHFANAEGINEQAIVTKLSVAGPRTVHSQIIHHREVPELIAGGSADAAIIYYHLALRYTRIFPDIFDLVDLGGVLLNPPRVENPATRYHVGIVADGGKWGEQFVSFMQGNTAQSLYEEHGLMRMY